MKIQQQGSCRLVLALIAALAVLAWAEVRADEKTHRQAVEELFNVCEMDSMIKQLNARLIEEQIKANPGQAGIRKELEAAYEGGLGWKSMKDGVSKIYMDSFSEQELRDLVVFYKTPTGKKALLKFPAMATQVNELVQKHVSSQMFQLCAALGRKAKAAAEVEKPGKSR